MDNKNENVYMKQENEYVQLDEKWAKIERVENICGVFCSTCLNYQRFAK